MFLGVLAIGLAAAWLLRSDDVEAAEIGRSAPDFTVPIIGGGTFSLADHVKTDGRPLVLNLWASWCPPCRAEMPEISIFGDAHPDVRVLGVAVDDTASAATAFAEEIGVSYDLAIGNTSVEAAYPYLGLPITYIIDGDGNVSEAFNGTVDTTTLEDLVFG